MEVRLNRSWNCLSAGTRMLVLHNDNVPWEKPGDVISHGFITVELLHASKKLLDIEPRMAYPFDIEIDFVTECRPTRELIPLQNRHKRREKKRNEYELMRRLGV
jgi:hypothetical protein